jgi:hypothetical protein
LKSVVLVQNQISAETGCTTAEIAAITGHSPRDVEAILEAHYPGRVELAEQAMMKLDARTETERKLQAELQSGIAVPILFQPKPLICLVGAQGLEPWTR